MTVYMGGRPGLTAEEQGRIEAFIRKAVVMGSNDCWEWLRAKQQGGYGMFRLWAHRSEPAHRASYYLFVGEIPSGLQIRHRCHNPGCVNPYHLRTGTAVENALDRKERLLGISHLEAAWAS